MIGRTRAEKTVLRSFEACDHEQAHYTVDTAGEDDQNKGSQANDNSAVGRNVRVKATTRVGRKRKTLGEVENAQVNVLELPVKKQRRSKKEAERDVSKGDDPVREGDDEPSNPVTKVKRGIGRGRSRKTAGELLEDNPIVMTIEAIEPEAQPRRRGRPRTRPHYDKLGGDDHSSQAAPTANPVLVSKGKRTTTEETREKIIQPESQPELAMQGTNVSANSGHNDEQSAQGARQKKADSFAPRKRDRKLTRLAFPQSEGSQATESETAVALPPKRRGRPRKLPVVTPLVKEQCDEQAKSQSQTNPPTLSEQKRAQKPQPVDDSSGDVVAQHDLHAQPIVGNAQLNEQTDTHEDKERVEKRQRDGANVMGNLCDSFDDYGHVNSSHPEQAADEAAKANKSRRRSPRRRDKDAPESDCAADPPLLVDGSTRRIEGGPSSKSNPRPRNKHNPLEEHGHKRESLVKEDDEQITETKPKRGKRCGLQQEDPVTMQGIPHHAGVGPQPEVVSAEKSIKPTNAKKRGRPKKPSVLQVKNERPSADALSGRFAPLSSNDQPHASLEIARQQATSHNEGHSPEADRRRDTAQEHPENLSPPASGADVQSPSERYKPIRQPSPLQPSTASPVVLLQISDPHPNKPRRALSERSNNIRAASVRLFGGGKPSSKPKQDDGRDLASIVDRFGGVKVPESLIGKGRVDGRFRFRL